MRFVLVVGLTAGILGFGGAPGSALADAAPRDSITPAQLADGSWALTGSLTAPDRSTASSVTVALSGSIEVTQGVLSAAACDDSVANPPQVSVQLRNTSTSAFTAFGAGVPTISAVGATPVSGSVSVPPATYELTVRYRCGSGESWRGQVAATPSVTVRTATLVESRNSTLACVATQSSTCPSTATTTLGVPNGYTVRFGVLGRLTWSDGVVTEERPTESQRLESAVTGGSWSTIGSSCTTTVTISTSRRYRCVVGSTNYNEIIVNQVSATSDYEIGLPVINPSAGLTGTSATITASFMRVYSDGSKWPVPAGASYLVEFQSPSTFGWTQVGSSRSSTREGFIDASYSITQTGQVRLRTGTSSSPPASVAVLTRTGKYLLSKTTGPGTANGGSTVSISATVEEELSNGTPGPAADSISVDLEFALAYSPTASDLVWTKVSSGTTIKGLVSATATAQYSGMWRFKKDDRFSPPVFVSVSGSSPISVAGTVVPASTETPFVSTKSRYTITAAISGYVGTESLRLFARIGDVDWVAVGSFPARTTSPIVGVYSLQAPAQWGEVVPEFQVRDVRGLVVGAGRASTLFIDGISGYLPKLSAPSRTYLPGEKVRFVSRIVAVTHLQKERPATWSGSAELERWDGTAWRPVKVLMSTRGSEVVLESEAVAGAQYRVTSSFAAGSSAPMSIRVATGAPELKVGWPDRVQVTRGLRVTAYLELASGERWGGSTSVQMRFRPPGTDRWYVKARGTMSSGRVVRLVAANPRSGCYRVILPEFGIESYAGYGVKSCRAE